MVKLETTFTAADMLTPEFAAKLADHTARFASDVALCCGDKQLNLDSLICILALELFRGVKVTIVAEGADEAQAAEEVRKVLQGEI
ncbi:MAG: HPr family phosphocarrier protein [Clostridia bacterium]|nr:HPr family phosphocarrier protein [Clostridia bacterium]